MAFCAIEAAKLRIGPKYLLATSVSVISLPRWRNELVPSILSFERIDHCEPAGERLQSLTSLSHRLAACRAPSARRWRCHAEWDRAKPGRLTRARELCERLDETAVLGSVVTGQFNNVVHRRRAGGRAPGIRLTARLRIGGVD